MGGQGGGSARFPAAVGPWLGWWQRTRLAREAAVLLAAGAFVQVVFRYRYDWPAHLVAGGAGVWVVASLVPRRLAGAAGLIAYVAMAALGWITEHLLFGPPDLVDVSFTLAGTVLALSFASEVAAADAGLRRRAGGCGVGLIAASLIYRYGLSMGPA